ncbi:MAG: hypothetical protein FWG63_03255 [Defluviitaleaceae bacterium]|nr:hypothetical protein [Defluviitaleaceae bacterium]
MNLTNRKAKIIVDIFMTKFVILSFVRWFGNQGLIFHGIVGTFFGFFLAMHLYLNRKWIVSVTKAMIAKRMNKKSKQLYTVNTILLVVWLIAIVTGFLAIPSYAFDVESFWVFSRIHAVSSRLGGILIIVHVFQHLGQIRSYIGLKGAKQSHT